MFLNLSLEIILFIFFSAIIFLIGSYYNSYKITAMLYAIILSDFLLQNLIFINNIKVKNIYLYSFIFLIILISFLVSKNKLYRNISDKWWLVLVYSIIITGLFFSVGLKFTIDLFQISALSKTLFQSTYSIFIWFLLSFFISIKLPLKK